MDFYTNFFSRGNKVYLRGYKDDKRITEVVDYHPYLFVPARADARTEFRTLDGKPVEKKHFRTIYDAKDFLNQFKEVSNMEIYGLEHFAYLFIYDRYHGDMLYDVSRINVISIDIETMSDDGFPNIELADKEITAITLSRRGEKIVFGCQPYTPSSNNITYLHCNDEYDMLEKFLRAWQSGRFMPDILTGWNIDFFDVPYIVNRITNLLGRKEAEKLSPFGFLEEREVTIHGKNVKTYAPAGIAVLDYMRLYKKYSFKNQESYALDYIAEQELKGFKKLDYSEYGSLHGLYVNNFQKYIDYNIRDVEVIDRLEEKLKFIEQVIALAYTARVNYADTFATVRPWDIIIHNYLLDRNIVIPQMKRKSNYESLAGGYVKDPKPGLKRWVVSFDLNSLYPHLIMHYNISPETLAGKINIPGVDELVKGNYNYPSEDHAIAANGALFRKNKQGFLAALMEQIYNDRSKFKKMMIDAKKRLETIEKNTEEHRLVSNEVARYHNMQIAMKTLLNSGYGACANEYFRWFNFDIAEAITVSGQLTIKWAERHINEYMNKVLKTNNVDYLIASDTDSAYVDMEPLVNASGITDRDKIVAMLDKFCEIKMQALFNKIYAELATYMNAYQQKMFMKRETIADKGIWRGKKMYILNALDIEGVRYQEPEIKIQGIEAVRSSTPKVCRTAIKEALKIIMNKDESDVHAYIAEFKNKFMSLPFEDISFPRGMNGIDKYADRSSIYAKGTPMHVKGALLFNHFITTNNLSNKYQLISNGDKIKFSYLKMPNPFRDTVIASVGPLPPEMNIERYIDYDMQFTKTFLEPIQSILDLIGWSSQKRSSLDDFFI